MTKTMSRPQFEYTNVLPTDDDEDLDAEGDVEFSAEPNFSSSNDGGVGGTSMIPRRRPRRCSVATLILLASAGAASLSFFSYRAGQRSFSATGNSPVKGGGEGWRGDESQPGRPGEDWREAKIVEPHVGKKKVLVTGAAGFIGSHVAEYFLER